MAEYNIQDLLETLEYVKEQMYEAERKLDQVKQSDAELIGAAIYEQKAWAKRYEFYYRKVKEAMANGEKIRCNRAISFGGRG